MVYTIYKTTNIINNKFYIGKHQTKDINDSYLGSGNALKAAIKKYGRKNFIKETLFIFDNELEMNEKEKEILTEAFINSNTNYNTGLGGEGGAQFKGKTHSDETKKKIADKLKGSKHSEETRKKLSESNKNRTVSEATRLKLSLRTKERFSTMSEESMIEFRSKVKNGMKRKNE